MKNIYIVNCNCNLVFKYKRKIRVQISEIQFWGIQVFIFIDFNSSFSAQFSSTYKVVKYLDDDDDSAVEIM